MIKRANENLLRHDLPPLPQRLTQHSLRKTCCSLRLAMERTWPTLLSSLDTLTLQ